MASGSDHHFIRTCAALSLLIISYAMADSAEEKQKCIEQLEGITTCLPYLGGDAKAPTPDCCNGLNEAIKNSNRCVCLIVKDRNDPDLGLKINITLALGLPNICKAPENLSQCPALLHLDPNSPEAQIFNQVKRNFTGADTSSPISSPSGESPPEGVRTSTPAKNNGCYSRKRMSVAEILVAGLLPIWLS